MAFPKVKLCWNGSKVKAEWHLGLFGFYDRGGAGGRLRGVVVSGRGLAAWLAALAFVAYFAGAAVLWGWLERRPYNYVTYADLILPTRWSGIQKLRGQALVAEAMDDLKAQKWNEGLQKLRVGIARNPEETKGRLALAEIFTAMKARRQAVEVYDGGLEFGYPGRDYVETMLRFAAQSEDYDWALRTCDRALALVGGGADRVPERKWIIGQKLSTLIAADRADEAIKLAEAEGETGSPSISEFRVLALLRAGQAPEAVAFLRDWAQRIGTETDTQVLRLQARAFREAGDLDGMERALEALRSRVPTDPRPYVYGIVQRLLAGRRAEAERATESFLLRFGGTAKYVEMLAAPLVEISELPLLDRLIDYARQQGFAPMPFERHKVQLLISQGKWPQAAALMKILQARETPAGADAEWQEIMNAQIQAVLDPADGAQSNLVTLVRQRQFTLSFYKTLIANLRAGGRPATAREVVTFAQGVYPQNPVVETARTELDAELASAQAASQSAVAPVLAASRAAPSASAAAVAAAATPAREAWTEAAFFAKLDELAKAADYPAALQQIRDVRRAQPAWLGGREADLARAEVRFNGRAGDLLALRSSARLYITGDRLRSAQMIEIARELRTAGRKDEAVLLLNELLAKVPDYSVARDLLAQWSPKPAAATP